MFINYPYAGNALQAPSNKSTVEGSVPYIIILNKEPLEMEHLKEFQVVSLRINFNVWVLTLQ